VVKLHGHVAFFGMDNCFFHGCKNSYTFCELCVFAVKIFYRKGAENAKIK
jgi:hypothetical protein